MERLLTIQLDGEDHALLKTAFSLSVIKELKDTNGVSILGEGKVIASNVKTQTLYGKIFGEGRYCAPLLLTRWECKFLAELSYGVIEYCDKKEDYGSTYIARKLRRQFSYLAWKGSIWKVIDDE